MLEIKEYLSSKKTYKESTDTWNDALKATNYANQNDSEVSPQSECPSSESLQHKCWRRYGEKRSLLHCWWECKLVAAEEKLWLGKTCTPVSIAALFANSQDMETSECPSTDDFIKMRGLEENEILPFATIWIGLKNIILWSILTEKGKYYMTSLTCGSKTNTKELLLYRTGTDSDSCPKGEKASKTN